ncbi:MAG: hypothetical protein BWY99_01787 [Synergistetes bacterium ADurb.BinA166]|nr:MAG: hypothetical protein BWY99_01787 [Synergistetes bacterium ADurb.BinA166]
MTERTTAPRSPKTASTSAGVPSTRTSTSDGSSAICPYLGSLKTHGKGPAAGPPLAKTTAGAVTRFWTSRISWNPSDCLCASKRARSSLARRTALTRLCAGAEYRRF